MTRIRQECPAHTCEASRSMCLRLSFKSGETFESGSQENRRRSELELVGFLFVDRDDLEIVAGSLQNNRFIDLAG